MIIIKESTAGALWQGLLNTLLSDGVQVSPRGKEVYELCPATLILNDARSNLFNCPSRKLQYRFSVAEWLWIWFGHDDVASIVQYNPQIAMFSDDGINFNGAYGPPIKAQWPEILQVFRDRDSRQAIIDIFAGWDRVRSSKDVPCTLTMQFLIRDQKLNTVVNMRSSDVWLGLPYDIFNFTMLANTLAAQLKVPVGWLTLNIGSSHLYATNLDDALKCASEQVESISSPQLVEPPPEWLDHTFMTRLMPFTHEEPWHTYARVLLARSSAEAWKELLWLHGSHTTNTT